jgi:dolichol-phosphate mannosyltransferase
MEIFGFTHNTYGSVSCIGSFIDHDDAEVLCMDFKVIIGLPAYNEEAVLGKVLDSMKQLKELLGESLHILVVNDGSTDNTEEILKAYANAYAYIKYISHSENRGLGLAMKTLFCQTINQYGEKDVLITLDADNTHSPQIIPAIIHKLKNENLDLVIASRFVPGGKEIGLSWNRKIYSRGAKLFLKLFFPIRNVSDYSCGFRAYNLGYLKKAMKLYNGELITTSGFECMAEILARFSKIGVKAGEYPLVLHYEQKEGVSKMKVQRTIMGYFSLLKKVKKPVVY